MFCVLLERVLGGPLNGMDHHTHISARGHRLSPPYKTHVAPLCEASDVTGPLFNHLFNIGAKTWRPWSLEVYG